LLVYTFSGFYFIINSAVNDWKLFPSLLSQVSCGLFFGLSKAKEGNASDISLQIEAEARDDLR
jgi:hypothetical protein